jgi:spore coat protein U-like protein
MRTVNLSDCPTVNTPPGTATLIFTVTVPKICAVSVPKSVNFGTVVKFSEAPNAPVTTQGTIRTTCSSGSPYTIYLGDGGQRLASGGNRQMKDSSGTNRLPYQLYKDSSLTQIWDASGGTTTLNGAGGQSGVGTGAAVDWPVYGQIPQVTLPSQAGAYSDTVVVTVAY